MHEDFWYDDSASVTDDGFTPTRPTRTASWGAPDTLHRTWEG